MRRFAAALLLILTACNAPAPSPSPTPTPEPTAADLAPLVALDVTLCDRTYGAEGTVVNGSDQTVDVFVDVQFIDVNEVMADSGIGQVSNLQPGQTGRWEAGANTERWSTCRAELGDVIAQ